MNIATENDKSPIRSTLRSTQQDELLLDSNHVGVNQHLITRDSCVSNFEIQEELNDSLQKPYMEPKVQNKRESLRQSELPDKVRISER